MCQRFIILFFIGIQFYNPIFPQRGAIPISKLETKHSKITRALVIGISQYKDSLIPDLQFAHRDAEEFAFYLHSQYKSTVDPENIVLLTNEQATLGRIMSALNWLLENSGEGDQVIIYIAGHGDVETKLISAPGYLLCWDSPHRSYFLNSLSVTILQELINTLSIKNKSKVILFVDACHSGNVAGSSIHGPGITLQNIIDAFKNQILVLSCQPDEVSIEGSQWDGGRGLFSYHCINGLIGFANLDKDSVIILKELERYVQDKVSQDAMKLGHSQTPIIRGNINQFISHINAKNQEDYMSNKAYQLQVLNSLSSRSVMHSEFSQLDSSIQRIYIDFQKALVRRDFFNAENGNSSADSLFIQLTKMVNDNVVLNSIKQIYVNALTDDANGVLQDLTNSNSQWFAKTKLSQAYSFKIYSQQLNRAAEILNQNHFFYKNLLARKYFFEAISKYLPNSTNKNSILSKEIIQLLNKARELESNGAYIYFYLMCVQATMSDNKDSTLYYFEETIKRSVNWVLPYVTVSQFLINRFKDIPSAKQYFSRVKLIDSTSTFVRTLEANLLFSENKFTECNSIFKELMQREPGNPFHVQNYGVSSLKLNDYDAALKAFHQAAALDSTAFLPYYYIAYIYYLKNDYSLANQVISKALLINSKNGSCLKLKGLIQYKLENLDSASENLEKSLEYNNKDYTVFLYLSKIFIRKNDIDKGLSYLKQSVENGLTDKAEVLNAKEFINLQNNPIIIDIISKLK